MKTGVCMKNINTGEIIQIYENIELSKAMIIVSALREKEENGNWYWIGKAENHKSL